MPLMNVKFPQNANEFILFLVTIANFDIIPTDAVFDLIFVWPEEDPFNQSFESFGLESYYAIANLGTVFAVVIVYLILMIIQFTAWVFASKMRRAKKVSEKLSNFLYWGGIIRLLMEGFLEMIIATMLNVRRNNWDMTYSLLLSNIFSWLMTLILTLFPVWIICFYSSRRE